MQSFFTVVSEDTSLSTGCDMSFIKNADLTLLVNRTDEMIYDMTCQPGTTSSTRIIICNKRAGSWRWDVQNVTLCTSKLIRIYSSSKIHYKFAQNIHHLLGNQ